MQAAAAPENANALPRDLPDSSSAKRAAEARDAEVAARRHKDGKDGATTILYARLGMKFKQYCALGSGAMLDGVALPESKIITDGTVTLAVVEAFMHDYVTQVKKRSGSRAGVDFLSAKSTEAYKDALADLKRDQLAREPWRFESEAHRT